MRQLNHALAMRRSAVDARMFHCHISPHARIAIRGLPIHEYNSIALIISSNSFGTCHARWQTWPGARRVPKTSSNVSGPCCDTRPSRSGLELMTGQDADDAVVGDDAFTADLAGAGDACRDAARSPGRRRRPRFGVEISDRSLATRRRSDPAP